MNPVNKNGDKNFPRESEIAENESGIQINGDTANKYSRNQLKNHTCPE